MQYSKVLPRQRVRKTEELKTEEFKAFKKWVRSQPTKIDACEALEISRPTLDKVIEKGTCHSTVAVKIRLVLVEAGLIKSN